VSQVLYTFDDLYIRPTRVKVEVRSLYNDPLYLFDSFSDTNPINIFNVDVGIGLGQAGTFAVSIEDSARDIDPTIFGLGNRVVISAGKTQASYEPILSGFCRALTPTRRNTGLLEYVMEGFGGAVVFNERIIKFRKIANRDNFTTAVPSPLDSKNQVWRLVKSLVEDNDVFPLLSLPSIISQGFTDNGIDKKSNEFISAVIEEGIEASHTMDTLANSTGSVWGVDARNDIFFKHAFLEHSGITVKDTVSDTDRSDRTSYFVNEWQFTDSMRKEDGFANRIFARTSSELIKDIVEEHSTGFTSLFDKAVAQMIVPTAPKFRNLGLIVSKQGEPLSEFNLLHGRIVLDLDGLPRGTKIADFQFSFKDIEEQPTNVYKINLTFAGINVDVGKKYWIILYERGQDEDNTLRWHHNNDFTTDTSVINKNSAFSDSDGKRTNPDLRWNVSTQGPVYAVATFDSVSHLVYGEDPLSVDKYGPVEMWLDVQGLDDVRSIDRYIHAILEFKAKPQRQYDINEVTIPDKLFQPGSMITIVDQMTGLTAAKNTMCEVQEVHYTWDAFTDGLGIRTCQIRPVGFVDFLSEMEVECE
jgi:hypothetical protein